MKFHHLAATFGRLQNQTLDLGPGLNILEAPNEAGKSTWCAFLLAMLYGIDSRQRDKAGFIAEKNRYAPWSGSAMSGQLDCTAGDVRMTLQRQTKRAAAPMGDFTARYTGTADAVPGLTGTNCGETLLGVPREVYERSAFIRQAGLGISADAELERRIVSLITTGDEGTSYSESHTALKKQLNRRRHNKTGEIPAAEAELADIRRQLDALTQLRQDLQQAQEEREQLLQRQNVLNQQLEARLRADAAARRAQLEEDLTAADDACHRVETLLHRLEEDHIPESGTIERLRGAIVNLEPIRRSAEDARRNRDAAQDTLRQAESAVNTHPYAGRTPEELRREPADPPAVKANLLPSIAIGLAVLAVVSGAAFLLWRTPLILPAGILCGGAASALLILHTKKNAKRSALLARFGSTDPSELTARIDTYAHLCAALDSARTEAAAQSAAYDALSASLSSNEQGILQEVQRFAPASFDIPAAVSALDECAARRKAAEEAQAAANDARSRAEMLRHRLAELPPAAEGAPDVPELTAEQLRTALADLQDRLAVQTSAADRLSGQLSAAGDADMLAARAGELESLLRTLEGEYDSIALAMAALDEANTALQSRFSPALGHRAAEIFSELTGGRYAGIVLDRSFRMSAEPTGDTVYRDAQLLSAGAADQLYLAVRLAICEMVLPAEHCPPLVLDDALTNYDDARCAAALDWLRKEAEHRQILLFTCHSREAEYFRSDPAVTIQRLTDAP